MNPIIQDTVTAIFTQTRLDECFRADVTKAVSAVFAAGESSGAVVVNSAPLSAEEIAAFRSIVRK